MNVALVEKIICLVRYRQMCNLQMELDRQCSNLSPLEGIWYFMKMTNVGLVIYSTIYGLGAEPWFQYLQTEKIENTKNKINIVNKW